MKRKKDYQSTRLLNSSRGLLRLTPRGRTMKWGDCLANDMPTYLGTLATEYRLLRDGGEDYIPTLNELYYAL